MKKTYIEKRKSKIYSDLNKSTITREKEKEKEKGKEKEKEKEKKLIKTQSELEKEYDIRSYSEYRIKDDDSTKDYINEDVEAKMIRLVSLKKKGGNVLDNINLVRKKIKPKDFPKINKALSIIEKIDIKRKIKKFFIKLKTKRKPVHIKLITIDFIQKLKKCIWKIYLKRYFFYLNKSMGGNLEEAVSKAKSKKNNNSILISPHASRKKLKKYNNKSIKFDLITKKSSLKKKNGIDYILEKIEKEKEEQKLKQSNLSNLNSVNEKVKKSQVHSKKDEFFKNTKIVKKKKSHKDIKIYKTKLSEKEKSLKDIKSKSNISAKDSSFFSGQSPSEITLINNKVDGNKGKDNLSEVLSSNGDGSNNIIKEVIQLKENKNNNKEFNDDDLYSIYSKEESKESKESKLTSISKKEKDVKKKRNSINSVQSKKVHRNESKKNMRVSAKLSGLKFKKKENEHSSIYDLIARKTTFDNKSKKASFLEKIEKNEKEDKEDKEEGNNEEEEEEEEDEEEEEEDDDEEEEEEEDSFNYNSKENEEEIDYSDEKINLVEYDLFYKEQFLKNDVFEYDVENIKDEEVEKINKEINKLEIQRKILEKKKLKEVMELKGENTKELQEEIDELKQKIKQIKNTVKEKIGLNLDTTEEFYKKGRLLNIYFNNKKDNNSPHFSLENSEEIGAREIIDFKPLRQEELIRRYFDDHCCLEERKQINKILVYSRYFCRYFVDNSAFDFASFFLIIINSILIFVSDPTDQNNIGNRTDNYFLIFYTFEAILKIITFTFYSAEDAYIKDYWNILDFLVVIIGLISFSVEILLGGKKLSGLSALKAFRILRPLKTVKRFRGLRKVVLALLASIGHLEETVLILFFFFLLFSITGLQMWQGLFYRRCMSINYGYFVSTSNDKYMCSFDSNCEDLNTYGKTFICAKGYLNPNSGAINFDDIGSSLITVFITATLEGWSYIYTYVSKTFKDKIYINPIIIFLYFHIFIYVGAFYLINLFLAVTNSEFEHHKNRSNIKEKKSFYKLIKSKYDINEKKKIEKKENEKQLKIKNNKKSDEALKDLYYKVKDEAFHINKNKRDIPILYSTIKDIYIMANNNPEELFLEKIRIKEEEKNLCLDIERQQKEIKLLIEEKKRERDKSKINSKNSTKVKNNKKVEKKEENKNKETKITERYKTSGVNFLSTNNGNYNMSIDDIKNSKLKLSKLNKEDLDIDVSEIVKLKDNINSNLIEYSIENTIKSFKEKIIILKTKMSQKQREEINNIKKDKEKNNEKENSNQISYFEDTSFEKKLSELQKKEKKEEDEDRDKTLNNFILRRKKTKLNTLSGQSFSFLNRNMKEKSSKRIESLFQNRGSLEDNNQNGDEVLINKEISFIDDLSLSNLNESSESDAYTRRLRYKKGGTNIHVSPSRNMFLTKLLMDDYKYSHDNLSYDDDLFNNNNNIFGFNKLRKSVNLKDTEIRCMTNLMDSIIENKNVVNTKTVGINLDLSVKTKFEKPHSSLNFITKNEDEQKFNDENIRFNLKKYLKKEAEKDNEFLNKDRRKSFLGFLEYAQYQKELKVLDDLIDCDIFETDRKNDDSFENDLHFLSEDSYLSRNACISIEDNDLLPNDISQKKIYQNEYLIHENINKNLNSNKLTKMIRAEIFDRQSINTNINLKTNELKIFYEKVNKNLDEQLYVNKRKIRLREEKNMNISGLIKDQNYSKNLKIVEEESDNEKKENNNNHSKNKELKNNDTKKNLNSLDEDENSKKIEEKILDEKKLIQNNDDENMNSNFNKSARNSDFPLINKQKTMKLLNARISTNKILFKPSDKNVFANINQSKNILRNSLQNPLFRTIKSIKKDSQNKISINPTINNRKNNSFIFKAKSIEKNLCKYPVENSNKYFVKEENKESTDPLTVEQERILPNLRGKRYYMNYLNNIIDKDLKVKDNFIIDHWKDEILGDKEEKIFERRLLPERKEAYFVFNDKKLKLKKYQYMNYDNIEHINNENENDISLLSHKLKYLPFNVLSLMPKRLRNFGKFMSKKTIAPGPLSFRPDSNFLSTVEMNNHQINWNKSISGRTTSTKMRNKGSLIMSSSYIENNIIQDEVRYKKIIMDRIYKKIDEFNYLTLSHYFLNEEKLYNKFIDIKKKEEAINIIKESNRKKYTRLIVRNEVEKILKFDLKTNTSKYIKWSGDEILYRSNVDEFKNKWNKIIYSLENFNIIIWHQNKTIKYLQKIRYAFYVFANNELFELIVLVIVMVNSIFMALDGNFLKPEILNKLNIGNYIFNSIFILEYVVKFIGLTPLVYFSDAFTYLDTLIIIFAVVDMATPNNSDTDVVGAKKSVSSQLSFLRVFRIFRVVRLAKLLRKFNMRAIIVSIKRALNDVYSLLLILIMFILIFELLGLSLLNGNKHYQSSLEGFYATYQILTLENWDGIFIEIWPLNHLCIFYFVIWIFLGNYIIFNLFISILLQSFGENEKKELEDLTDDEEIEKIYYLPDYLYIIKNNIKDKNLWKIQAKRKKVNNEIFTRKIDNINAFSKDLINPMSTSNNLDISKISIKDDENEEEEEEKNSETITVLSLNNEGNAEEEDFNNSRIIGNEKIRKWNKINKIFQKNECEKSLFFISQGYGFRMFCMNLINNVWFDHFILCIITLSSIRLIIDTFISGYTFVVLFDISDSVFNIIFLIEATIKIIAMGLVLEEGTYLRDNWNKIDALIVICSFIEFHNISQKYFFKNNKSSSVDFLKVLRLLRTLRPLRIISHNFHLKLIITSLFDAISSIFHTLLILFVVLFMFSTVGISLFYSSFHNCYTLKNHGFWNLAIDSFNNILADYEIKNDITSISRFCADKYNGIMDTGPSFKFSNLKSSLITSYILSTMEGWPDIMNSYRIYNDMYGLYFIAFNLVVSYFFLNLFIGVMFKYFNEAFKREQKIAKDDKKAPKYYDFLLQILSANSDYIIWNKPMKGTIKYYLREFVDNDIFQYTIIFIILLNMILMAVSYDGSSANLANLLKTLNYFFTIIFIIECLLKLFAYGIKPYFHISWNKFDFFVVIVSLIDWIVNNVDGIDASFLKSFQIIRVLKVLRVSRVLRLVKALKGLEKLIQTLQWSISALINVLSLNIIIYCIFALAGYYLYDGEKYEVYKDNYVYINEYFNMDNFFNAYLLIFRCSTGENWHNMMMEMAYRNDGRGEGYSIIFFIVGNFITAIILLNLLLMVTLQQYDEFTDKKYNPIEKFNSFLADFNNGWNKFSTDEDEGFRIKKTLVIQFFSELNWRKLNFPEKGRLEYIKRYVSDLKLYYDYDNCIYYHDVIFKVIKKQMGSQIDRNNKENNLIFKTEKILEKKIKKLINDYIIKKGDKNKANQILKTFNPLTAHLYYKLSFQYMKAFINFYKENAEILNLGESNIESLNGFNSSNEMSENSEESDNSNSNSSNSNSKDNESKSENNSIINSYLNKEEKSSSKNNGNSDSKNKSKSKSNNSSNHFIKFVNNSSSSFRKSSEEVQESSINNNENQKIEQNQKNENENEVKKE